MRSNEENWYVLFALAAQEDTLCEILNQDPCIHAFSAKYEYYRKDRKQIEIKSLFPGYLFIQTAMDSLSFDQWLQSLETKKGLIRQLQYKQTPSLRDEEIYILEKFLDAEGVFRMSYGHLREGKLVIDQGPLMHFEPYIVKYDKRNRLVTLDLYFMDQHWLAGVTLQEQEEN